MSGKMMRTVGLLLALAVVVFLVHKHLQTAPVAHNHQVGGAFSIPTDGTAAGNGMYSPEDLVAGNPNY